MSGQAYEFCPGVGPVPMGTSLQHVGDASETQPSAVPEPTEAPRQQVLPILRDAVPGTAASALEDAARNLQAAGAALAAPLRPRDIVKLARQRLREVRAELRRFPKLRREEAELEALIAAAKRGAANVRHIDTARRAV